VTADVAALFARLPQCETAADCAALEAEVWALYQSDLRAEGCGLVARRCRERAVWIDRGRPGPAPAFDWKAPEYILHGESTPKEPTK
jgi:hypothetical protein